MSEESGIIEIKYTARAPRVETKISESGHMLTIRVMRKKKEVFRIKAEVNDAFNIDVILNSLEFATGTRKISKIQWSKGDIIFQRFMDVQTFKDYYRSKPRHLTIMLFEPVKILKDQDERQKAMFEAHVSGNEHYGLKKTAAILQGSYYWQNVTRDIARFIRECEHFSKKLNIFDKNIGESHEQFI